MDKLQGLGATALISVLISALISALVSALGIWVTYHFGKKAKIDELRIKKIHELAEGISPLFQEIHESYENFGRYYEKNFGAVRSVGEAADVFMKRELYKEDREKVHSLLEKCEKLDDLVKNARVYLNKRLMNSMSDYSSLCQFSFQTDDMFESTYYHDFFVNLLEKGNISKRQRIHKYIMKNLHKLAK